MSPRSNSAPLPRGLDVPASAHSTRKDGASPLTATTTTTTPTPSSWQVAHAGPLAALDAMQSAVSLSDDHVYSVDGVSYPSVTQIDSQLAKPGLDRWKLRVEREGLAKVAFENPAAPGETVASYASRLSRLAGGPASERLSGAGRGTAVHAAIEALLTGSESPSLVGIQELMFENWLSWWAASPYTVVRAEFRVFHPVLGYCGTSDALLHDGAGFILADWKTTKRTSTPWAEYSFQSAAYRAALYELGFPPMRGLIVQVDRDGQGIGTHWLEDDISWPFAAFRGLVETKRYLDICRAPAAPRKPAGNPFLPENFAD